MYFVLYDRNLDSIGNPYILESWSRIERAVDFDELKIVGEQIPYSADPFFVVINNKQGKMMFSGLASTPSVDEESKKTRISLKDYATLFNTEIILNWKSFRGVTVAEYIDFILSEWMYQTQIGFRQILWDLKSLESVLLDDSIIPKESIENVSVSALIFDAIQFYDLYYKADLNLSKKSLNFVFKRAKTSPISVRLRDFGVTTIEKSFGDYNRATVYDYDYSMKSHWALTMNNTIMKMPDLDVELVYPSKNRNFVSAYKPPEGVVENAEEEERKRQDALSEALYNALMGLVGNRYQENIDLDAQQHKSILDLTSVDFSYIVSVYTDEGYYRDLPVGEIETDSNGKHIVRLGHRVQELTQEL